MALIAIFGDTHFGASNSNDFFINYQDEFFREIFPILKSLGVTHFIHLGDIYDVRKSINYKVLKRTFSFFTEALLKSGFDIHLLVGNHDAYYKNSLEINAVRELLGWTGFNIYDSPQEIQIDSKKFLMMPWICSDNQEEALSLLDSSSADVCCGHFDISGFYMMKNVMNRSGLASSIFDKFTRTFSGHYHIPGDNNRIMYVGTPYELTWADYGDKKRIILYDTETDKLQLLENTKNIFEKIFYEKGVDISDKDYYNKIIKIYVDQRDNGYEFDQFLKSVQEHNPRTINVIENVTTVEDETISEFIKKDTLEFLTEYIDEQESDTAYELKILMQDLYNTALELK